MAIDIKRLPPIMRIFVPPLVIIAVLFSLYYFLLDLPKRETIARLDKEIFNLNNEINISSIKASRLDELKKRNTILQARLKELREQLPEEKEVSPLLKQISDLGAKSGLNILLWKPGDRKQNPSGLYDEIPVKMDVAGGYHDLGVFFSHISRLTRIVNISEIKMGNVKIERGSPVIQVGFTATTFAAVEEIKKK